jgi:hypothetical protein
MAGLTIGRFAAAEGVSVETVRCHQRRGLPARPERSMRAAARAAGRDPGALEYTQR